jgi:hypothetical protein
MHYTPHLDAMVRASQSKTPVNTHPVQLRIAPLPFAEQLNVWVNHQLTLQLPAAAAADIKQLSRLLYLLPAATAHPPQLAAASGLAR